MFGMVRKILITDVYKCHKSVKAQVCIFKENVLGDTTLGVTRVPSIPSNVKHRWHVWVEGAIFSVFLVAFLSCSDCFTSSIDPFFVVIISNHSDIADWHSQVRTIFACFLSNLHKRIPKLSQGLSSSVAWPLWTVWRTILVGGRIWNNGSQVLTWKTIFMR